MNPDTYTDESDCFPLTSAQLLARNEAWPQFAGAGEGNGQPLSVPEALRRAWAEHCGVDDPGPDWNPNDLSRFDREQFDLFRAGWDACINRVGD